MRRGAGGNAIVRPRRVMPTPATVTRRPRTRRLCFVARSCSPQSSSGVADARLSRLVMVATSHCLGLRPCVEVVDMLLDEASVQPEDQSLAGAPQPLQQPAVELQICRLLIGLEIVGTALGAVRANVREHV